MTIKVLVLCTGNTASSILGEAQFNPLSQWSIQAYGVGGQQVNPMTMELQEAYRAAQRIHQESEV